MNKKELVDNIAKETELHKKDVTEMLNGILKVIPEVLKDGDKVSLVGFGTFSISEHKARNGRNLKTGKMITGKMITIPAHKVIRFRAGKELKDQVS